MTTLLQNKIYDRQEQEYLEKIRREEEQRQLDRSNSNYRNREPKTIEVLAEIIYRHEYLQQTLGVVEFFNQLSDAKKNSLKHWLETIILAAKNEKLI